MQTFSQKTVELGRMGCYEDEEMSRLNPTTKVVTFIVDDVVRRPTKFTFDAQRRRKKTRITAISNKEDDYCDLLSILLAQEGLNVTWTDDPSTVTAAHFGTGSSMPKRVKRTKEVQNSQENEPDFQGAKPIEKTPARPTKRLKMAANPNQQG